MREFLFRAKKYEKSVFDETDWVYGSLIDSGNHEHVFIFPWINGASTMPVGKLVYANMETVNPETIGQFTGLMDKKGKCIFKGDIVRYMDKNIMVVVWNKESASFACAYSTENFNYCATMINSHMYLEVIGNIYDNPELLEG